MKRNASYENKSALIEIRASEHMTKTSNFFRSIKRHAIAIILDTTKTQLVASEIH